MKGAMFLADTFENYPVSPIKLTDGSLHLKSFMSMACPGVIAVGSSKEAQKALKVSSELEVINFYSCHGNLEFMPLIPEGAKGSIFWVVNPMLDKLTVGLLSIPQYTWLKYIP